MTAPPHPAYERDPRSTELAVEVVAVGGSQGRPWAELDDTILYPEGGGQPADRGTLRRPGAPDIAVLDVQREDGVIRHFLATPSSPGPAMLTLDWGRRFDFTQQHTAQHLLTAVALAQFGWATTAFHLDEHHADIELDVAALSREQLAALEEAAAAEIRAARPVRTRRVDRDEMATLPVRSRGLPAGHQGDIRLVEIVGLDLNTCGGTHLANTAEIEALALLAGERLRGGTRVHWVAGGRLRRLLARHEERNSALGALLSCGPDDLTSVAGQRLAQLQEAERERRRLVDRLAAAEGERLAARPDLFVAAHFPADDGAFLQRLARAFAPLAPDKLALFTAGAGDEGFFVVVAGAASGVATATAGALASELLAGRGGGAAGLFQGRAQNLGGRATLIPRLERLLAAPSTAGSG